MDASSPKDEADIDPIILADVARVVEQLLKQGGGAGASELADLQALLGPDSQGHVLDAVEHDSERIIDILEVQQQGQQQQQWQHQEQEQQQEEQAVDDQQQQGDEQQYGESQEQCVQMASAKEDNDTMTALTTTEATGNNTSSNSKLPAPITITTTTFATTFSQDDLTSPSLMKQNKALLSPTLTFSNNSNTTDWTDPEEKRRIRTRNTSTSGSTSPSSSSAPSTPSILLSPGGHAFGPDREDHVYFEHPPANYYPPQVTKKLPTASSAVPYQTRIHSGSSSSSSSTNLLSSSSSACSLSSSGDKANKDNHPSSVIPNNAGDGAATTAANSHYASGQIGLGVTTSATGAAADHATCMINSALLPSSSLKITRPRRKKALLIGINYFGDPNQLLGCINDTRDIFGFLNGYYGFRYQDTVMLTDDQIYEDKRPTGANIRYWMKWLVQDAEPHDSLFFHYAGHGGRVKDFSYNGSSEHLGDEADGYDEVIFPSDYLRAGIISDDEMYDLLVKDLPDGVQLTALIDSCHSGTMLDLPFVYNGDQFTQLEPHMPRTKVGAMAEMTVDEASHNTITATAVSAANGTGGAPQSPISVGYLTGAALESVIAADPVTGSRSISTADEISSSEPTTKRKESADDAVQEEQQQDASAKKSKDNQGAAKSTSFPLEPAAPIEKPPPSPVSPTARPRSPIAPQKRIKNEGQGLHLFRKTKGNVVMFSGCRDDQASADIRANDKNNTVTKVGPRDKDGPSSPGMPFHQPQSFTAPMARGAVSYAWIQCLSRKPEQTYEELLQSMRFFMKQRDLEQIPQLGSGLPMDMNTIFTL